MQPWLRKAYLYTWFSEEEVDEVFILGVTLDSKRTQRRRPATTKKSNNRKETDP